MVTGPREHTLDPKPCERFSVLSLIVRTVREVDLHVPFEVMTSLGLVRSHEGFKSADIEDVTIIFSNGSESVAAITYSNPDETELENAVDDATQMLLGKSSGGAILTSRISAKRTCHPHPHCPNRKPREPSRCRPSPSTMAAGRSNSSATMPRSSVRVGEEFMKTSP